jgi:MATE family multidrug resistance protein
MRSFDDQNCSVKTCEPSPAHAPLPRSFSEINQMVMLAVPLIVGLAGITALSNVDSFVLGKLNSTALAVASLTHSALAIFYAGLYGMAGAVGLLVARAHGANDLRRSSLVLRKGLLFGFITGCGGCVVMSACLPLLYLGGFPSDVVQHISGYWLLMAVSLVPYTVAMVVKHFFDATDRAWLGAFLACIPVIVHLPLSYVLVFGLEDQFGLGLVGSGLATVLSFSLGLLLMYLRVPRIGVIEAAKENTETIVELKREGYPISVQYVAESSAVAFGGLMIGFLGTNALAANQIAFSTAVLIYMLPLGISGAVTVRISQALGQGELLRVRGIGQAGLIVVTGWMVIFSVLLIYFARPLANLFTSDDELILLTGSLFAAIAFMQVFDGVQSVSLGALRGMMDNAWPSRFSLFSYWIVALPLSYFFGFVCGWGAAGVWAGFGSGLALAAIVLTHRFYALSRSNLASSGPSQV